MSKVPELIVIGCGSRGTGYAGFVKNFPEKAKIVACAEPRDFYRNRVGDDHNIPEEFRFHDWRDVLARPKFADAVLICTQDAMHEEPAIAAAKLGYNILLEKPMAPTAAACRRIVAAVKEANVTFAVCHVLRYTAFTRKLKEVLNTGAIGDIVSIQHLEGLQHWHQAHSFVRGNWRNEEESSFMLLAKCCHDLDWLRYVMGFKCLKAHSFGSLFHFNKANQPAGAADRCVDCPAGVEAFCPYSALKIYLRDRVFKGNTGWPTAVLTTDTTAEGVLKALQEGPYGRCVYACDNDVVDHQTVNLEFENGATAVFTMAGCSQYGKRQMAIFGSHGEIRGDGETLTLHTYLTGETRSIPIPPPDPGDRHGGGDSNLLKSFVKAIRTGDRTELITGLESSMESHMLVFAAERSRHENRAVSMAEMLKK